MCMRRRLLSFLPFKNKKLTRWKELIVNESKYAPNGVLLRSPYRPCPAWYVGEQQDSNPLELSTRHDRGFHVYPDKPTVGPVATDPDVVFDGATVVWVEMEVEGFIASGR